MEGNENIESKNSDSVHFSKLAGEGQDSNNNPSSAQDSSQNQVINKIYSASLLGTDVKVIEIEAAFVRALPNFTITGLANNSIQESKQRVQAALSAIDYVLPPLKITINLAPSDLAKSGSYFDLPIALIIYNQHTHLDGQIFAFGELGLDGSVKYTPHIYPLLFGIASKFEGAKVIVPKSAKKVIEAIPSLHFIFVDTLKEAIDFLHNPLPSQDSISLDLPFEFLEIEGEKYYYQSEFEKDFIQVLNQELAKRAALIAASGMHNIIFEGSPGCGKSMIAHRMRYILPPMSIEEMMSSFKLCALHLEQAEFYTPLRPFRNPHQSASKASILGSATQSEPKPGEIALAHNGILFFDELPHFKRDILESLREPLENNRFNVSRVNSKLDYETSFLFIGAQNPCPCGNLLSLSKECRCQDKDIKAYKNRLSEPFLDRIDMFIYMNENTNTSNVPKDLDSKSMQEQVFSAFRFMKARGQHQFNGKLNEKEIEQFCVLNAEANVILDRASTSFNLSIRAQNKIKKLARTIADIENSMEIGKKHVLEALNYRKV